MQAQMTFLNEGRTRSPAEGSLVWMRMRYGDACIWRGAYSMMSMNSMSCAPSRGTCALGLEGSKNALRHSRPVDTSCLLAQPSVWCTCMHN